LEKALEELATLDKNAPQNNGGANPQVVQYHRSRATQIRKVFDVADDKDKEDWLRQIADSLSSASQASATTDMAAQKDLEGYADHYAKTFPGTAIAAYFGYRAITADYGRKMAGVANANTMLALQKEYIEKLDKFVTANPKAAETPEALQQLGMLNEFQIK